MKKIFFSLLTVLLFFFIINFLSGFIVRNRYIELEPINKSVMDKTYGYFYPSQDKTILFPGLAPYKVRTDSYGFRYSGVDTKEAVLIKPKAQRILCIGDSVTFGLFVDDKSTYPFKIQELINARNADAVVFNAGIGGGSLHDYLYYLNIKGLQLKPDVVILNFCPNDLDELAKNDTPFYKKLLDDSSDLYRRLKLMKFLRLFRGFEIQYKFNKHLSHIEDKRVRNILKANRNNIDDILFVDTETSGVQINDPYNESIKEKWDIYFNKLKELNDLLIKQNIKLVFFIYPEMVTLFDMTNGLYQDKLIGFLKANNIRYIDLRARFLKEKNRYLELYNNPPRDFHLGDYGNKILADELYHLIFN